MAGGESHASNPLVADFVLLAHKLEKLGFTYSRGNIIVIESDEV